MSESNRCLKLCNLNNERGIEMGGIEDVSLPQLYAFVLRDILRECQDELRFVSEYRL
jgi:hypothetical protein